MFFQTLVWCWNSWEASLWSNSLGGTAASYVCKISKILRVSLSSRPGRVQRLGLVMRIWIRLPWKWLESFWCFGDVGCWLGWWHSSLKGFYSTSRKKVLRLRNQLAWIHLEISQWLSCLAFTFISGLSRSKTTSYVQFKLLSQLLSFH